MLMTTHNQTLWKVLFWLLRLYICVCTSTKKRSPNFVILYADDLGYGDLSMHGNTGISTPNLDRFGSQSLQLRQFYAGAALCTPSRAAFMTGRYAVRTGCGGKTGRGTVFHPHSKNGIDATEQVTFATALKKYSPHNYATKLVGKWHLGSRPPHLPCDHGFDEYFGLLASTDSGTTNVWRHTTDDAYYDNDMITPHLYPLPLIDECSKIIEQPTDVSKLTQRYTDKAIEFMTRNSKEDRPFVLVLAYQQIHVPTFASEPFCNVSQRYLGDVIAELDDSIGQIMQFMSTSDAFANARHDTLTIFTSDNGAQRGGRWTEWYDMGSNAPFYGAKWSQWEGGWRVPAFVHWPRVIAPHINMHSITGQIDILPTILRLGGVDLRSVNIFAHINATHRVVQPTIDGMDISDIFFLANATIEDKNGLDYRRSIKERELQLGHDCFYYWMGSVIDSGYDALWAVRCGRFKAHFKSMDLDLLKKPLIFDVTEDSSESMFLDETSPVYSDVYSDLTFKFERMIDNVTRELEMNRITNQLLTNECCFTMCCLPQWQSNFSQLFVDLRPIKGNLTVKMRDRNQRQCNCNDLFATTKRYDRNCKKFEWYSPATATRKQWRHIRLCDEKHTRRKHTEAIAIAKDHDHDQTTMIAQLKNENNQLKVQIVQLETNMRQLNDMRVDAAFPIYSYSVYSVVTITVALIGFAPIFRRHCCRVNRN